MPITIGNTIIVADEIDIGQRVSDLFGVRPEDLVAIGRAAMAAKNDATPADPINAPGQLAYIYGTRAARMLFGPRGYVIDRRDNIESTVHPSTRIRVIYQNTDTACLPHSAPKAISEKGAAAERMIELAEPFLFSDMEEERKAKLKEAVASENETVWFLCVASGRDGGFSAEISRPRRIENHQFGQFIERIFLISGGDGGVSRISPVDASEQEYEINVSRK